MKVKKILFTPDITFICPFCGMQVAADKDKGVIHGLPVCHEFDVKESDEFMKAVRVKMFPETDN